MNLSQVAMIQYSCHEVEKQSGHAVTREQKRELIHKVQMATTAETQVILAQDLGIKPSVVNKQQNHADRSVTLTMTFTAEQMAVLQQAKALSSHELSNGTWADLVVLLANKMIAQKTKVLRPSPHVRSGHSIASFCRPMENVNSKIQSPVANATQHTFRKSITAGPCLVVEVLIPKICAFCARPTTATFTDLTPLRRGKEGRETQIEFEPAYWPPEIKELQTGKGSSSDGESHSEKLATPLFSGALFYSLDGSEIKPLPAGRGAFFQISDRKKHEIKIMNETKKSWGKIRFDCGEYKNGTKIFFQNGGTYGPGWRTNPMPKNPAKCRWHPDHS